MTRIAVLVVASMLLLAGAVPAQTDRLRVAVTTSFHNSGLAELLVPEIEKDLGLRIELLVVGTGQALRLGREGDVDAILVHSRAAEEAFVAEGYGTHRREIMYNDFVVLGPSDDPAGIVEATSVADALTRIARTGSFFASRGDDSGTHRREQALWAGSGLYPADARSVWYRSVGAGMGATLNLASGMSAYALSDRASWLSFANKRDLIMLFEGDAALFNQYAYLPVDPVRHPHVRYQQAMRLEDWLTSDRAQTLIGDYAIGGEKLFVPNAGARVSRD